MKDALTKAVELRTTVNELNNERRGLEQAKRDLESEQSRLRENLKAVQKDDAVRARFLKKLAEVEDNLETVTEALSAKANEVRVAETKWEQHLATLVVE